MGWSVDERTFPWEIDGFPGGMKGIAIDGKSVIDEISLLKVDGWDG